MHKEQGFGHMNFLYKRMQNIFNNFMEIVLRNDCPPWPLEYLCCSSFLRAVVLDKGHQQHLEEERMNHISRYQWWLTSNFVLVCLGPTDLSMKRQLASSSGSSNSSSSRPQLSPTEINAVRQLVAGYRESAAFLLRSADELENLILQQNWVRWWPYSLGPKFAVSTKDILLSQQRYVWSYCTKSFKRNTSITPQLSLIRKVMCYGASKEHWPLKYLTYCNVSSLLLFVLMCQHKY